METFNASVTYKSASDPPDKVAVQFLVFSLKAYTSLPPDEFNCKLVVAPSNFKSLPPLALISNNAADKLLKETSLPPKWLFLHSHSRYLLSEWMHQNRHSSCNSMTDNPETSSSNRFLHSTQFHILCAERVLRSMSLPPEAVIFCNSGNVMYTLRIVFLRDLNISENRNFLSSLYTYRVSFFTSMRRFSIDSSWLLSSPRSCLLCNHSTPSSRYANS